MISLGNKQQACWSPSDAEVNQWLPRAYPRSYRIFLMLPQQRMFVITSKAKLTLANILATYKPLIAKKKNDARH